MDKLIELFFSNIFVIIVVITGIVKFFNKVTGNEYKTDMNGKRQKPLKEAKKFNLFDFDLEKWLEEQSGKQRNSPNGIPNTKKQTNQSKISSNIVTESGTNNFQTSINEGSKLIKTFNQTNSLIEEETSKQFEIDLTDLQKAVVMAEVLGPARAKRKTFRL